MPTLTQVHSKLNLPKRLILRNYLKYRRPRLRSWQMNSCPESLSSQHQTSELTAWTLATCPLFALLARKHSSYQTLNRHLVLTTYSTHFPNGNSSTIPKATQFLVICACLTSPLKVDTITEKRVEYITPKQGQSILSLRKARTTCPALGMLQRPRLMLCCPHSSPTPIAETTWYSAQIQTHSRAKTQILIRNNP